MDQQSGYFDRLSQGIAKIKEGFQEVEAEQNRLKEMTLDTSAACEYFGISKPTLIKRRKQNLIPYVRIGNEYRYLTPEKGQACSK